VFNSSYSHSQKNLDTFELAYNFAIASLSKKLQTTVEIRKKLLARQTSTEIIDAVIQKCCELQYLDDIRFAERRAEVLLESGRKVGFQAVQDLTRRGIDYETATRLVHRLSAEMEPIPQLIDAIEMRYRNIRDELLDSKRRQRIVSYYQRRGFRVSDILRAFELIRVAAED
jgi:SOS response regulatory protein OraA/RecX